MSRELRREQLEMELMQLLNGIGVGGNILAHDAALRAKVEALEKENAQYRTIPYDNDGTPFAAASAWRAECSRVHAQLATMTAERDHLQAELREKNGFVGGNW